MSLLQMSRSGAVMILVIAVVRALTVNKLPKKSFLALWGVAAARLLIPYSLPSAFSVYSLVGRFVPTTEVGDAIPTVPFVPVAPENHMISQPVTPQPTAPAAHMTAIPIDPWMVVWLVGVLVCAAFFVTAYLKCRREFMASLPVDNEYAKRWLGEHRIYRTIEIRQSGRISAPLTYGVFHPVILMPKTADWNDLDTLNYVLTHEYVHIRRFDAVTKLVLTAAACVHWFNPAVWIMYVLANRDIELSCDETVIRQFGERTKSAYAMTLICMEETRSGLTPLCNNFSKNAIEERIIAIMKMKKKSTAVIICAAMLVAGISAVFATSPKPTEAKNIENLPSAVMTNTTTTPAPTLGEQDVSQATPERVHSITSSASDTSATPQTTPVAPEQDVESVQQSDDTSAEPVVNTTEPDTASVEDYSNVDYTKYRKDDPIYMKYCPVEVWGIPEGPIAAGTPLFAHSEEDFREMIRQLRMRGYDGGFEWMGFPADDRCFVVLSEDFDGVVRTVKAPEQYNPDWTYRTNSKGETYGTIVDFRILGYYPDLIGVMASNGTTGYAFLKEMNYHGYEGPMETLEDTAAYMEWGKTQPPVIKIPVYDVDRNNIVGYYEAENADSQDIAQDRVNEILSNLERGLRQNTDKTEEEIAQELENYKQSHGWN